MLSQSAERVKRRSVVDECRCNTDIVCGFKAGRRGSSEERRGSKSSMKEMSGEWLESGEKRGWDRVWRSRV